ncbi:hypothetical protein D3C75_1045590 [compost metagenome]
MDALAVAELAAIQGGSAARAIGQAFRASFRADIQGVFQAATAAGVATHQRALHTALQRVQHVCASACCPQRLAHCPAEGLAQAVAPAEQQ